MTYPGGKMNFISFHLVSNTLTKWSGLVSYTGHDGFFYFKTPIKQGVHKIDRIGKGLVYFEDEIVGATWHKLSGKSLMSIYEQVKSNKLYYFRDIDNRKYRVNLKDVS